MKVLDVIMHVKEFLFLTKQIISNIESSIFYRSNMEDLELENYDLPVIR